MKAWDNFLTLQEEELGQKIVNKWLRPLKVLDFDACNLFLEASDSFQISWFEEHIRPKAQELLVNNNNKTIKVHLTVDGNAINHKGKSKKSPAKTISSVTTAVNRFSPTHDELDPRCTFEHFVVWQNNLLPFKLLNGLTEIPAFNPIYLHGCPGTGKTHLLMAAAQILRKKGLKTLYCRAESFTDHVVTAIRAGEMSLFRQAYRSVDALIIDDVHLFSNKGATQEELFHTFNTLHVAGKQIILSANCPPSQLQMIEPRLVSRFEWGIVLLLELALKDELEKILLEKADAFDFPLHPKVSEFLLETFTSSTKSLIRAFEALVLRCHLGQTSTNSTLTVTAAKHLLNDLIIEEQKTVLTPKKIIDTVAETFGIKTEDVIGKAQNRDTVLPRQIAMFLCRSELKLPFTKIGELFSRDHSTVISSCRIIQKGLDENEQEITFPHASIFKKLKAT
jgi:chromosomal replication initiator protein